MADRDPPPSLENVGARLKAHQDAAAEKHEAEEKKHEAAQGSGIGYRIGIELLASVIAGFGIGWFIDSQLNTQPIFMLAFTALGFTAGVLAVLRIAKGLDQRIGYGKAIRDKEGRDKAARDKDAAGKPPPNAWDDDDD